MLPVENNRGQLSLPLERDLPWKNLTPCNGYTASRPIEHHPVGAETLEKATVIATVLPVCKCGVPYVYHQ